MFSLLTQVSKEVETMFILLTLASSTGSGTQDDVQVGVRQ